MTFEEFAMARLPNLLRYAVVLTGDRDLAQDVVQRMVLNDVNLLLDRCLDRQPFPDPPADPAEAVEDLLSVAAAALARG